MIDFLVAQAKTNEKEIESEYANVHYMPGVRKMDKQLSFVACVCLCDLKNHNLSVYTMNCVHVILSIPLK